MIYKYMLVALLAVGLCAGVLMQAQASGEEQPVETSLRIAVADPSRIFQQMQETQHHIERMQASQGELEAENMQRQERLQELQSSLVRLRAGTPQYEQRSQEVAEAEIEYRTWAQVMDMRIRHEQKEAIRTLFDRIRNATAEVAEERGIDLVITEYRPEIPDDLGAINIEQLQALIGQQNILYRADMVDISDAVIARLDQKFRERQ